MTNTPVLEAVGLTKRFRKRTVLVDASLRVGAGEAVALVGENGAGKTTLLRLCGGLDTPDAGVVHRTGAVGYCPQEPGVIDLLTADEHLVLFGSSAGLPRPYALETGRRLLDSFGFAAAGGTVARNLSGGNRQKLNLALALLGDPSLLLLDEPYQGFDHGSYIDFWQHVDGWRAAGRAVIVVTHLLTEQGRVDRVVEIRDGRVHEPVAVQVRRPEEVGP